MIDLRDYGYIANDADCIEDHIPARITEMHRERYNVICEHGEISSTLKGSFFHRAEERSDFPAVGDFVMIKYSENGSVIVKLLERKSKFSRTDFSGHAAGYAKTIREQVVAANFDYVFIMSSLNLDFNVNRIARYMTLAKRSGAIPVVILTKADLCEDYEEQISAVKRMANDVDIVALSSVTGIGLDRLAQYMRPGKTIVFLGMSGVGKSSLLNALAGRELMAVKEIREDDARGRHTTTHRELIRLENGVMIIDTPGMRELGLWDASEGIKGVFPDVEALIEQCRFADCGHGNEPGCAVQAALKDGSLARQQWESYAAQKREMAFVEKRVMTKSKKPKSKL